MAVEVKVGKASRVWCWDYLCVGKFILARVPPEAPWDIPFPVPLSLPPQFASGGSPKRDDGRHYDSQRKHLLSFRPHIL